MDLAHQTYCKHARLVFRYKCHTSFYDMQMVCVVALDDARFLGQQVLRYEGDSSVRHTFSFMLIIMQGYLKIH